MTSAIPDGVDETTDRILVGASEQFRRFGVQRSTMEDVAKRSGVSRITVYRRFATKELLVERTVQHEFRNFFDEFVGALAGATTLEERVELGFATSLRVVRSNPLINALFVADNDMLLSSVVGDDGNTLATVARFLGGQLRREQEAGNIDSTIDPDLVAEVMVRVCTSFLLIPSHKIDLDDEAQLRSVARTILVPMLRPHPS
ncbi:TetR/AcrR family transcriptional regulator [Nocardioides humilatus]|uniref:TetR/AcrR family transcriptional regulator n=1 Tax=Nocardioides humilatus TaxID=2607660 RepID=A0A5B1L6X7_9ACTN|nr:TetR/AcrR family transcriptional regulator [Nocardioides humilatus]KAA1415479.1 TetR/AcrR family transcriptional regulator [Nocardioides humilatus]